MAKDKLLSKVFRKIAELRWKNATAEERQANAVRLNEAKWAKWARENPDKVAEAEARRKKRALKKKRDAKARG